MSANCLLPTKKLTMRWTWVCLALYLVFLYYPLITKAGISVDDWGDISHNLNCHSYWDCYVNWFPLFSNRPLAPLPITTLTFVFGKWYPAYLFINSCCYLLALGICARVIGQVTNLQSAMIIMLLGAAPIIAMPVITSPINQSTATFSFLLWSASLWSLLQFTKSQKRLGWVLAYTFLLLAFLTYEIILPLLVFTLLLPWVIDDQKYKPWSLRYFYHFLLPICAVLFLITLWQKGIAPQLMEVDSRLKFVPEHTIAKLYTFFDVFYRQIPLLFLKIPNFLTVTASLTALFGTGVLLLINKEYSPHSQSTYHPRLLIAAIASFFASSAIFILSDESAIVGGYQARGLSSTWFTFVILLSVVNVHSAALRRIWLTLLTIFSMLTILCFCIQRSQVILAWQMQQHIIQDAKSLILTRSLPNGAILMGDVPHYLHKNYNDEIVFSQPWDFGAAMAIATQNQIQQGPVIDSTRQELRQLRLENGIVLAQNFGGASLNQFWVYRYNPAIESGTLIQITDKAQFEQLLQSLKR